MIVQSVLSNNHQMLYQLNLADPENQSLNRQEISVSNQSAKVNAKVWQTKKFAVIQEDVRALKPTDYCINWILSIC